MPVIDRALSVREASDRASSAACSEAGGLDSDACSRLSHIALSIASSRPLVAFRSTDKTVDPRTVPRSAGMFANSSVKGTPAS